MSDNLELKRDNVSNSKKILCYNIINKKICNYGTKCMYAHSLNEQKIDSMRHKIYTILKNDSILNELDLINDEKLFNTMIQLTKVCSFCLKKICPGGYNCRNGAINNKYKLCYDDLMYGNCKKNNCLSVHLTLRGLIPYIKQKKPELEVNGEKKVYGDKNRYSWPKSFKNIVEKKPDKIKTNYKNDKSKKILKEIPGILLTEKFFLNNFDKKINNQYLSSESSEEDEENTQSIINYLNDISDDNSMEESIFLI